MIVKSAGKSDLGLVRKVNEDYIRLLPENNLFIVCDGMGGHNAGEIASMTACDIITALYTTFYDRLLGDEQLRLPRVFPPSTDVLVKAVRIANHTIFRQAAENPSLAGMGTTIVAAAIEKDIVTLLHVGDSRIYRFFDNTLTPLTVDHSWVAELEQSEQITAEEARTLVNRNVITRALGVRENVEIDVSVRKIAENEIFLMCTDGLCGFVEDSEIKHVVASCGADLERLVTELVRMANDRGGLDNVSVVALRVTGKIDPSDLPKLKTVTVEAEPPDYLEAERQWGTTAVVYMKEKHPSGESEEIGKSPTKFIAFSVVVILIVIVLYLILKG